MTIHGWKTKFKEIRREFGYKEADDFLEVVSHSEFVEIKDAAHMVAGDRNDIFAAAAIEFLENHSPLKEN